MPVNVSSLRDQIHRYAEQSAGLIEQRNAHIERMSACFAPSYDADALLAAAIAASRLQSTQHWSGALFNCDERMPQQIPHGVDPSDYALIASDGSQIMPDRHKPVVFAYVQAACACIIYGCADNPAAHKLARELQTQKRSRLLFEGELNVGENVNPAAEISNLRDMMEIELLADACARFHAAGVRPVVIADGSIVPFALLNERTLSNAAQSGKLLRPLLEALSIMRASGAVVAGYIDRPNSNTVVKTCALDGTPFDTITEVAVRTAELRVEGVFDRHIMERVLRPGHRSALFDPNWLVNDARYLGEHAMRACYLNLGDGDGSRAVLARLEMPRWCASPENLSMVTGILKRHAALSTERYPFILKAAHEEAVVGKDDQKEIETALEQALLQRGIRPRYSPKQAAKDRL